MDGYVVEPIAATEVPAFLDAMREAFLDEPHDDQHALWERRLEPDRTLVARSGGAIVATSGLFSLRLAVPGAVVPMAGVTAVGVVPVQRGHGLLDRMMRGHLEAIHERGEEAISALWASGAGIYGRWGYGPATWAAELDVRATEARFLVPPPAMALTAGTPEELLPRTREIHAPLVAARPGMLVRDEHGWAERIADFEHEREGAGRLRAVACDEGYALYAVREEHEEERPPLIIEIRELMAATPGAAAALWAHLIGMALSRRTRYWLAAPDDPIPHLLTDSRIVRRSLTDGLYVRLVDVPRALAQRSYAAPLDVVLEVRDEICPWNAGRWRLTADGCEPTDAPPGLALDVRELGAAYLGGTSLTALAAAGRVEERTPGALEAAALAFRAAREPWCPEFF